VIRSVSRAPARNLFANSELETLGLRISSLMEDRHETVMVGRG
jgi:hypothetical protein